MTTPLLTIGIPTYDRAPQLDRKLGLLAGALNASGLRNSVEILVLDNGSHDETPAALARAMTLPATIRAIRNGANLGCDANYLRTIEFAAGEWCWLLGDDEPIDPTRLNVLVERLSSEGADAVHLKVPSAASGRNFDERHFSSIESLSRSFYSMLALQHLSANVLRTAFARTALVEAYRSVGLLHAYTPLVIAAVARGRGLRTYDTGLLLDPAVVQEGTSVRWPGVAAVFGAMETLARSVAPGVGQELLARDARERKAQLRFFALREVLGIQKTGFTTERMLNLVRTLPPRDWDLPFSLAAAQAVAATGLLPHAIAAAATLAPKSGIVARLRGYYGASDAGDLTNRAKAALSRGRRQDDPDSEY